MFFSEGTYYISRKCGISPNCLPNVSLQRDLNITHQPQKP